MKKYLFAPLLLALGSTLLAQSPRVSLYEEFTGETCPPCASTNPGLNTLLLSATNATRIVAIKWQVPIPSAPSNTWSLYQTNKTEIDWRWKSVANGGYGYTPVINSAPSSKIDGREATVFGASSGHPANLNNTVITNAVSKASPFNIVINRSAITNTSTSAIVNVTVQATMPYTTTSNLVFRTVLVERLIQFSVAPGSNGETKFEDAARKSYPTLQNGTALPQTWTQGQVMTFSINCVFPNYIHSNLEIEFVGFIQNDGTQKVEQVARTGMPTQTFDAVAASVNPPFTCSSSNTMAPVVPVKNDGQSDITAITITPYVDGVAKTPTQWTGVINPGFSGFIPLNAFSIGSVSGQHTFSYTISGLNSTDNNLSNNGASGTFYGVSNYQSTPIVEGFSASGWPYNQWLVTNANATNATWSFANGIEAYGLGSGNCLKYDFYNNTVLNDQDELLLPPVDLTGVGIPVMTFDIAYELRTASSSDKLELMLSTNCGATWTSMWSAAGTSLAVNQVPDPNAYASPQGSDWTNISVSLPGFNQANVLAKFVTTNKNGNNLFLDNINLAASSIPDGLSKNMASSLNLNVSPNPSSGVTLLRIHSNKNQLAKLSVMNVLGESVLQTNLELNAGTTSSSIDLSAYANGIYLISVEAENFKTSSRVSLSH